MKNWVNVLLLPANLLYKHPPCFGKDGLGWKGKPLRYYLTAGEAMCDASFIEEKIGVKMRLPEYCHKCKGWHALPAECECTDSEGESKHIYITREAAEEVKTCRERKSDKGKSVKLKLNIIPCEKDEGFFLSKKPKKHGCRAWWQSDLACRRAMFGF